MKTTPFARALMTSMMLLGLGVGVAPICKAEVFDPDAGLSDTSVEAPVSTETPGNLSRPGLDPFRALISPPEVPTPIPSSAPSARPPPPVRQPDPPVQFRVEAIAGEKGNYLAVIEYGGQSYIVGPGEKVPSDGPAVMEVRAVTEERVDVWDLKIQRIVPQSLKN